MTSWERFKRMYEHREADRIPIIDEPWSGTLRRWRREGMPEGMDWCDYFDVDKLGIINIDISPRMPEITLEETDRYYIRTSPWGVTMKHFKEEDSTPEFLDFTITTQEAWDQAKKQMTLEDDRIPWEMLRQNYDKWRAEGRWIRAVFWFGFDVTHSWMMGTENTLIAMMEEPELVEDMFDTYLSRCETLFSRVWDAGYHSTKSSGTTTWATREPPFSRRTCTAACCSRTTSARWTGRTTAASTRSCIPAAT